MLYFIPNVRSASHLLMTPFQITMARERHFASLPAIPAQGQHYRTVKVGSVWRMRLV